MSSVAVTGASGYVGSRLAERFEASGVQVYRLSRELAPGRASDTWVSFTLGQTLDPSLFSKRGIKTLIHSAYAFSAATWEEIDRINVEGSRALIRAAQAGGVERIILISTLSAFEGCLSLYGKAKLLIEKDVLTAGGCVVRSGLVFGDSPGGMLGRILSQAKSGAWVPVLHHPAPLYLTHEADLCEWVYRLATSSWPPQRRLFIAAGQKPWTLRQIVHELTGAPKPPVHTIPVPWILAWAGLRALEGVGIHLTFKSDSILSLVKKNPDIEREELRPPDLVFRSPS